MRNHLLQRFQAQSRWRNDTTHSQFEILDLTLKCLKISSCNEKPVDRTDMKSQLIEMMTEGSSTDILYTRISSYAARSLEFGHCCSPQAQVRVFSQQLVNHVMIGFEHGFCVRSEGLKLRIVTTHIVPIEYFQCLVRLLQTVHIQGNQT